MNSLIDTLLESKLSSKCWEVSRAILAADQERSRANMIGTPAADCQKTADLASPGQSSLPGALRIFDVSSPREALIFLRFHDQQCKRKRAGTSVPSMLGPRRKGRRVEEGFAKTVGSAANGTPAGVARIGSRQPHCDDGHESRTRTASRLGGITRTVAFFCRPPNRCPAPG